MADFSEIESLVIEKGRHGGFAIKAERFVEGPILLQAFETADSASSWLKDALASWAIQVQD